VAVISYGFAVDEALNIYQITWDTETLFSHLKKRGYQFENTHMTQRHRIEKLMGVLTVAFALCDQWGSKLEEATGVRLKSHGYRATSVLRRGFESLHQILHMPWRFANELGEFISCIIKSHLSGNIIV
jgi:hypothetical protein